MNNSGSNTASALAEAQVLNKYYKMISVERKLGKDIVELIRDGEYHSIVLTGHAGDGKTSILVQVLKELNMLKDNEPLSEEMEFDADGIKLYAVKDMSELSSEKQLEYFYKALNSVYEGRSSMVVSNTGPLLDCLEQIAENEYKREGKSFEESDKVAQQNLILNQLDENKNKEIKFGKYKVLIINIARIDNVIFAQKVLDKMLDSQLWEPCNNCEYKNNCPMYFNRNIMSNHKERVVKFILSFYRYLYEYDKRMTVRQMLSQLSFSITGNLTCENVAKNKQKNLNYKFDYLFTNLFFGYCGFNVIDTAMQIQGIKYANEIGLDGIALNADYKLFVTGDLKDLSSDVQDLASYKMDIFNRKYFYTDNIDIFNQKDTMKDMIMYRRAIRRLYIMLSDGVNNNYEEIFDEIFGIGFNSYVNLIHKRCTSKSKNEVRNTIVDALYMEATGTSIKGSEYIPITIRRNDNVYQKVMIMEGKIKKEDLKIETEDVNDVFSDDIPTKKVVLNVAGKEKYPLSLPLITYFSEIANGSIFTEADPALTHGISRLKAVLQKYASDNKEDGIVKVFVNKTSQAECIEIQLENDKIYFS